ncbi:RNase H-like domain found in reverse transcriptase [Popillia japonica]|uniref:RNA-directed DNA polymerase n=1 Tax=Popillia japonica TaxID=7064 RepID=A0AAW1KFJ9_POPJA
MNVVSNEGVSPDPSKIETIQNYPAPKSYDEVERFVAFANYYRKFIKNYADIVAPLNQLTKKHVKFEWENDCQRAFENLKQKLINPPILEYPNFSEDNEFHLRTDASGFAIGDVLANSNDKPIAFASKSLNKAERNYCTLEKELLAIVWAVKYFRPYLFGKKFKIFTDHKPLIYLFSMTNPSSRLTKFRLLLEEYDFEINYVKGKDNVVADALSRITSDELKELTPNVFVVTRSKSIERPKTDKETTISTRDRLDHPKTDKETTISTRDRLDHPGLVELLKKPLQSVELRPMNANEFEPLLKEIKVPCQKFSISVSLRRRVIYIIQNSRSASAFEASLRDLKCIYNKHNIQELCIIKNKTTSQFIMKISKVKEEKLASINISIARGAESIVNKEMRQLILNDFHMLPTGGHAGSRTAAWPTSAPPKKEITTYETPVSTVVAQAERPNPPPITNSLQSGKKQTRPIHPKNLAQTLKKPPGTATETDEADSSEEPGSDLEEAPRNGNDTENTGQGSHGRTKPPPPLILPKKMRDSHKILVAQVKAFTNDFHVAHREHDTAIYFKTQEKRMPL